MATDRNIVEMINLIRGKQSDNQILIATVNSTSPLSLKLYDLVVSKNIYSDHELKLNKGDTVVIYRDGISFYILERVVKKS